MARRGPRVFYELTFEGGIFDANPKRSVKDALADGIEDVGEQGAEMYRGFVREGGFVATGQFVNSIESDFRRKSGEVVGYAKLAPDASWPEADRPPVTWMERGTRDGVRLRKGIRAADKAARRLRKLNFESIFGPGIVRRMERK